MFLILTTAFLDILGMAIFLPVLPAMIDSFGMVSSWTGYTQAIYALGVFTGGLFFGKLSDIYGRKKMLSYTSIINLSSYLIMLVSIWKLNIIDDATLLGSSEWIWISFSHITSIFEGFTPIFGLFLISRFIWWLWGAWFWVIQAYISDISAPSEKAKRMGLMGAAFGFAFLIWPAIGGILAKFTTIPNIIILCSIVILINVLSIWIILKEPIKHTEQLDIHLIDFHFSKTVIILLILSFWSTLGFSAIQSMSSQFYHDRFGFSPSQIGYTMAMVWCISIIYQWWLVKYIRRMWDEVQMIYFAFIILTIGFIGFSYNMSPYWLFFWIALFPLGMWSFQPSVMSLISNKAGREVGKVMWYNTSIQSIWQIIWPITAWLLYTPWGNLPFLVSSWIFFLLLLISIFWLR